MRLNEKCPKETFCPHNFGITQSGVLDEDNVTLPVRVDVNANYEKPEIEVQSEVRPPPMALRLTVTVSNLVAGIAYTLYRYADETLVPVKNFNALHTNAVSSWNFSGTSFPFVIVQNIMSDEKVFYRAVPSLSP